MRPARLFLLRHAPAVPRGTPGYADDARPLTLDGARKMRRAARGVRRLVGRVDRVLTSPLPRARRTAEIVGRELGKEPQDLDALAPGRPPAEVEKALAREKPGSRLLLVGHEPGLSELAASLTGSRRAGIAFRKGGLARVDVAGAPAGRPGTLVWLATPKILRWIAREGA